MCVLLVLRLFMMKYCFFNRLEQIFKNLVNLLISPCQILPTENRWRHCEYTHGGLIAMMFWTGLGWYKWTKSFTIVNKYFIYTYVQFLLTKQAYVLVSGLALAFANWANGSRKQKLAQENKNWLKSTKSTTFQNTATPYITRTPRVSQIFFQYNVCENVSRRSL